MRITKKQAIQQCKELWKDIAKQGVSKVAYFRKHEHIGHWDCPLCLWVEQGKQYARDSHILGQTTDTNLWCCYAKRVCPLIEQYGSSCMQLGYSDLEILDKKWLNYIKELV